MTDNKPKVKFTPGIDLMEFGFGGMTCNVCGAVLLAKTGIAHAEWHRALGDAE